MGAHHRWRTLLPNLDHRVWILALGRLLLQLGIGFTLFYAPIFFVNQVGLSATAVGLGLGAQSITGIGGRLLGGSMADSPRWGRRQTLLLAAAISAVADGVFVLSTGFSTFVAGNLLMGMGIGLYWPAAEAMVADLTAAAARNEAYALVRLADSLGVSLGVMLGGWLITATGAYRALFVIDGLTFLIFLAIVALALAETRPAQRQPSQFWQGWGVALKDRRLLTFFVVNILFTTYLSQVQSTLPVYLNRFAQLPNGQPFSEQVLSGLFAAHVTLTAILQLPVARRLRQLRAARALMISLGLWAVGYGAVWLTSTGAALVWAGVGLTILAGATVVYMPVASTLVTDLATSDLRGVYLSVNSLCWAVGYLIGPPAGGWALDQPTAIAQGFWLALSALCLPGLLILQHLDRQTPGEQMQPPATLKP
ncbi:MAG: MFS transporter [Cyanobacteria bacterium J06628_6]